MPLQLLLLQIQAAGVMINEVFTLPTNMPGEPDLTGVRVLEVTGETVTFARVDSLGGNRIIVPLDKIVAVDYPPFTQ
ncbi:hypothetical protein [Caldifermentibacillus hisashii]|uniref:hypothetical protein n=1 Tax=Caldifermentibacillus hisashii TaxID=996558 RepID=UPI0031B67AC8